MIKNIKAVSLAEVEGILKKHPQMEENMAAKNTSNYIERFVKIKPAKAEEIAKALREMKIEKLKEKNIAKIIDFMPEDSEDLKKIFVGEDFGLENDEISSILEKLKSFK